MVRLGVLDEAAFIVMFRRADKKIVGPSQSAARLESSKVFSKEFMRLMLCRIVWKLVSMPPSQRSQT